MKCANFILTAFLWCFAISFPAHAQLKPEQQTGSIIPVKPEPVDAKRAGEVRKYFAQCVYGRAKSKVNALLAHSYISTVDLAAAQIRDIKRELDLEHCLSEQVRIDQFALGLSIKPSVLRDLLAEEVYLAAHRTVPQLLPDAAPLQFQLSPINEDPASAQALTTFGDCTIRQNVAGSDALLRTMPGSEQERNAAAALAPALGACLFVGQQFSLKPANIRALIAYAMWARFRS